MNVMIKIYISLVVLLLLGCGNTPNNYKAQDTVTTNQKKTKKVITKPINNKVSLTVVSDPKDARVRILNIGPKYENGIMLKKGKYHIEVSAKGFETYRKWMDVNDNKKINISLNQIIDNSKSDIAFLESISKGIPALPIESLKSENFRNYLTCSLKSPKEYISNKLKRLEENFANKKFDNNFERGRAQIAHEKLIKQEIDQAAKFCDKKIIAPIFYADAYLPIMDQVSTSGEYAWISTWYEAIVDGNRYYSSGGKMMIKPISDLMLDNYYCFARSCESFSINISIKKLEELFNTLPNYTGTKEKYKKGKEIKGKIYYSMMQHDIFTLYPEYYEFREFSGVYKNWKSWRREGIPYEKRDQYVFKK